MSVFKDYRFYVLALVVVGAVLDIYTTLLQPNLEANPIFFMIGIYGMIILKIIGVSYLSYKFLKAHNLDKWNRFVWANLIIMLICLQFFATINNYTVAQSFAPGEVHPGPTTDIERMNQFETYIKFTLLYYFYPLLVCMASFALFNKMTLEKGDYE